MKEKKIRKTNIEILTDIMAFNSPMVQIFIVNAVRHQAELVAKQDPAKLAKSPGFPAMFSAHAWVDAAKTIQHQMDEQYGDAT